MPTIAAVAAGVLAGSLLAFPQSSSVEEPRVERGGSNGTNIETVVRDRGVSGGGGPGGSGAGETPVGRSAGGGTSGAPACTYTALTAQEALAAGLLSPDEGGLDNVQREQGAYARRDCTASGGARSLLWVPSDDAGAVPPAGVPSVTPALLAEEARSSLVLPAPEVGVSPDGLNENPALVHLPTWWWVENGQPLTQRTAVGPVWAEVTAQPVASSWVTSDGQRTDCAGLGMAWARGMDDLEPASCSHTYTRANADEVADIQVAWHVTWVGSGESGGTLEPFTISSRIEVPVYERHAIVTSSG